ncbi:hypothetical protein EQG64_08960 [Streptomyces sp. S6]|nr:hypothetical protein EQG64_08960 [Streptomyces sp. S6]
MTPAGSAGLTGCLEEMDRRGLIPDGCLAVCCVGPAARGWADEGGTYDFHVVSTGPWTGEGARALPVGLDPAEVPSVALSVAGRRWEITYWLESQVRQVLAKVTRERFEGGRLGGRGADRRRGAVPGADERPPSHSAARSGRRSASGRSTAPRSGPS